MNQLPQALSADRLQPLDQWAEPGFDPKQLIGILLRRWRLILGCLVTVTLLASLIVFQITPRYTATSSVAVSTEKTQVVNVEQVVSGMAPDTATMETQAALLRSTNLMGKLIDKLKLDQDAEFNPLIKAQRGEFDLRTPSSWFGGASLQNADNTALTPSQRTELIKQVSNAIEIKVVPRSYVTTVSATTTDPAKSQRIANALAELYINDQIENKYEATRRANKWLEGRLEELKAQAIAADRAAEQYKVATGLVSSAETGGNVVEMQQMTEINSQLILARANRAEKQAQLDQVRRLMNNGGGGVETSSAALASPTIINLRGQEAEVLRKLSELRATYGDRHPKIINTNAELRDLREKINLEVRKIAAATANDLAVASAREGVLAGSLSSARSRTGQSGLGQVRLRELEREAESAKSLYETFLNRYKETKEQIGIQTPDARIVSGAVRPVIASYPRKLPTIALAAFFSLAAGIGLAFFLEQLDNNIRRPEEIEGLGGGTVLGLIPFIKDPLPTPEDVVTDDPLSPVSENLRSLSHALKLVDIDNPLKVVLFTSALPGEGKSFLSATFARTAALAGQRVLLIDADLRRPRVHKIFGSKNDHAGLSDVLSGKSSLDEAVIKDPNSDLYVLTAGSHVPNPASILGSQQMAHFIRQMRELFDLVVLDTPPFAPLVDTRLVSELVDRTILVVRWGHVPAPALKNTLQEMRKSNVKLAGTVMTQVDMRRHAYYSYGHYTYYYYRYGSYNYAAAA